MSKKFNINDYPGKYVMHCKTEEEAKDFCRVLHEAGRKWNSDDIYIGDYFPYTTSYPGAFCINFNCGLFGDKEDYINMHYTILEWSDFMGKEFTKDDLKTGDIVKRRNGETRIYIKEADMFIGSGVGDWEYGHAYTSDLSSVTALRYDIVKIIRPAVISDISFDAFEKNLGRLVFEREETIEMTLEEVCKALGKNVKIVKE